jgi:hypothetical protein
MSTLENANTTPTRKHAHPSAIPLEETTERCPLCGQPVTQAQYTRIQKQIEAQVRARLEQAEKTLKDGFARQVKAETEKVHREAKKAAEQQIKVSLANQEKTISQRLQAQRAVLDQSRSAAINAEKEKYFREKLKLQEQLQDMQRRLQAKTAHELGEPAEVDLFKSLENAFPHDRLSRVPKGQKGPDVIMEVVHDGGVIGSIILDSKNRKRWSNKFTAKLRADQFAKGADFALLSTSTFPKSAQQLHLQDGVIVASPARVVVPVDLLRRQIVESHRLKLTTDARSEKADRLFDYIVSPACMDLLNRIGNLTTEMVDLDRTETTVHEKTWTKRAELIRGVRNVQDEFSAAVSRITTASKGS